MAGRCVICEGRIVNGRCRDCGMDYSRMAEHKYRLNEDCGTYSPGARKQKKDYEQTLLGKEEKTAGGGKKGRRTQTKTGETGRRRASVIKWIAAVWVVLGILSGIVTEFPDWFSGFGKKAEQAADWLDENTGIEIDIGDDPEEDTDFDASENEAATTEGLYEYVKSEMPADGTEWSEFLSAGYYTVGETIPQGTYRVTVSEGKGSLHVEDEDNAVWYYSWLESGNEVEDLRLYPGARVTVEGGCELEFEAENARPEALRPYTADDSLEDVEICTGGEYLVGSDIAPGRYDVQYDPDGDTGIAELRVEAEDGDRQMIFLSGYGPDEGYRDVFHNLTLTGGDTVVLEGAMENDRVYLLPDLEFP